MKKTKYIGLLSTLILAMMIPLNVEAVSIKGTSIEGATSAEVNKKVPIKFKVEFDGLDKNSKDGSGILLVMFNFKVDSKTLAVYADTSSEWENIISKDENDVYTVISAIKENMPNTCADDFLYCGNYEITLNFAMLEDGTSVGQIDMLEVGAGLYPVGLEEPDEDKIEAIVYESNSFHKITAIRESPQTYTYEPPKIKVEDTPDITKVIKDNSPEEKKPSTNKPVIDTLPTGPSSSLFLKELKVEGYDLNFYRDKENYSLLIDKDVNSLKIDASLEDESSTYEIKGADDLKANDYKVKIEVTSTNGDKKTYTIDADIKEDRNEWLGEEVEIYGLKIKKRYLVYGGIGLGVIIVLIIFKVLIKVIGNKIGNRKIKKALKNIDK